MQIVQIKDVHNGVTYFQKALQCIECGHSDIFKEKRDIWREMEED
jgi:hypothetical protein